VTITTNQGEVSAMIIRTLLMMLGASAAAAPASAQFSPAWRWNRHAVFVSTTGAINAVRGYEFTVTEPITVTAIGVFDHETGFGSAATSQSFPGLAQAHPVNLWQLVTPSTGMQLASGVVAAGQVTPLCQDGYRYASISPTALTPGNTYVVSAYWPENTGSGNFDPYPDVQSSGALVTLDPRISIVQARHAIFITGNTFPSSQGGVTNGYIGVLNMRIGAGSCEPNPGADLATTFRGGNGQAGNMFDLTALTFQGLTIDGWQINLGNDVTNATPVEVSIYWREGSYVGHESSPDGWTLLGAVNVLSWGPNQATPVPLGGLAIPGGATRGIFITTNFITSQPPPQSPPFLNYTDGGVTTANADLQISPAIGKANPRFTGNTFLNKTWNGGVLYTVGLGCYANCDGSTTAPVLNVQDFTCFLQRYAAGESYANCDNSTVAPVLNVQDFTCFLQSYAAGCP
jgi:hypothetical protein